MMFYYEKPADYQGLLPENFRDYEEIKALNNCLNLQMDGLFRDIKATSANRSASQCNSDGAARWERILGITSPRGSGIEARRDAIRAKLLSQGPINLLTLKEVVQAYMGLEVDIGIDGYTVVIHYRGESRIPDLRPLFSNIYELIPAAMLAEISYLYLIWNELDTQRLTFDSLDAKGLTFSSFERGTWIE